MSGRASYLVYWDNDALIDFEGLKDRSERKPVFNSVDKLRALGPSLIRPHAGSLTGEADLLELRPKGGDTYVRPIYARRGDEYVILAVSVEPDKKDFDTAVASAHERLKRYRDQDALSGSPKPKTKGSRKKRSGR